MKRIVQTMERLDQGQLHPQPEHTSKEIFEQLLLTAIRNIYMNLRQNLVTVRHE
jgi:hypothetical protein